MLGAELVADMRECAGSKGVDMRNEPVIATDGKATRSSRRRVLFWCGVVLVIAGTTALAYVGWQFVGTNIVARHAQAEKLDDLRQRWASGVDEADAGDASAVLRIPRFGDDYEVPIVEGVSADDLAAGVGHEPGTASVGRRGNYVLAGHRVTHGEPFAHFPDLAKGDEIRIITRTRTYVYELDAGGNALEVDFSAGWVMGPHPDFPGAPASDRLITLVTCADVFDTRRRLVAFGHLVQSTTRPITRNG